MNKNPYNKNPFKKDVVLQRAIDNLYNALKESEYGKSYSWDELYRLCGVKELSLPKLYYICLRVNAILAAHDSRYMVTEHGRGKRMLNPREHDDKAKAKVKESIKKYKAAGQILASTNVDLLTSDEKKRIVDDANRFRTLELFTTELLKKKKLTNKAKAEQASIAFDMLRFISKTNDSSE